MVNPGTVRDLPPEASRALYRVAQEALTDADDESVAAAPSRPAPSAT